MDGFTVTNEEWVFPFRRHRRYTTLWQPAASANMLSINLS